MDLVQFYEKINNDVGFWVWPAGAVAMLVLFTLALWMGAALANAERVTFLRSLALAPAQLVLVVPAGYFIFLMLFGSDLREWATVTNLAAGIALTLLVDMVLLVVLLPIFGSTFAQGFFIWLVRLPIVALLGALVGGASFVGMAIWQASREPGGDEWLTWIGWISAGLVVVAIGVFVGTRVMQQPTGIKRTGR